MNAITNWVEFETTKFLTKQLLSLVPSTDGETYEGVPFPENKLLDIYTLYDKYKVLLYRRLLYGSINPEEFIPHMKYEWKYFWEAGLPKVGLIISTHPFRSTYKFKNELDYFTVIEDCGVDTTEIRRVSDFGDMRPVDLLVRFITSIVGYNMIRPYESPDPSVPRYCIDISELENYEHRDGYWKTNGYALFDYVDGALSFAELHMDGNVLTDTNDANTTSDRMLEFGLMKFIVGLTAIQTIKYHLAYTHVQVSDKLNTLIEKELDPTNPIRRLLTIISYEVYGVNEGSMLFILGENGVLSGASNVTQKGVRDYIKDSYERFDFREIMDVARITALGTGVGITTKEMADIFPRSANKDAKYSDMSAVDVQWWRTNLSNIPMVNRLAEWWHIVYRFSDSFVNIHYPTQYVSQNTKHFLDRMKSEYEMTEEKSDKEFLIDICAMALMVGVIHEQYSNDTIANLAMNPFVLSLSWKENDSMELTDHINDFSNQMYLTLTFLGTKLGSKRLHGNFEHLCSGPHKDQELVVFRKFQADILHYIKELDEAGNGKETTILHPENVECSVRW
jgi:hypothetical protein